jgi:hypothetical protein
MQRTFVDEKGFAEIRAMGGKISTTPTTHKGDKLCSLTRRFCKSINAETPVFLPFTEIALVNGKKGECHDNVKRCVARYGGAPQYGWLIWQDATVVLDAEFHSVWASPDDGWKDISPRAGGEELALFLPDYKRTFDCDTMTTYCNRMWVPGEKKYQFMDFNSQPSKSERFVVDAVGAKWKALIPSLDTVITVNAAE